MPPTAVRETLYYSKTLMPGQRKALRRAILPDKRLNGANCG